MNTHLKYLMPIIKVDKVRLTYRGFDVADHGYGCWAWFHPEYDGDEDQRCGTGNSFKDIQEQIDEWLLEQEDE